MYIYQLAATVLLSTTILSAYLRSYNVQFRAILNHNSSKLPSYLTLAATISILFSLLLIMLWLRLKVLLKPKNDSQKLKKLYSTQRAPIDQTDTKDSNTSQLIHALKNHLCLELG